MKKRSFASKMISMIQEVDEFLAQHPTLSRLSEAILSIENGNKRVDFEGEIDGKKYYFRVYRVKENLIRIDLVSGQDVL